MEIAASTAPSRTSCVPRNSKKRPKQILIIRYRAMPLGDFVKRPAKPANRVCQLKPVPISLQRSRAG